MFNKGLILCIYVGMDDNWERIWKRKSERCCVILCILVLEGVSLIIKDDSVIVCMFFFFDMFIYMCMRKDNYECVF